MPKLFCALGVASCLILLTALSPNVCTTWQDTNGRPPVVTLKTWTANPDGSVVVLVTISERTEWGKGACVGPCRTSFQLRNCTISTYERVNADTHQWYLTVMPTVSARRWHLTLVVTLPASWGEDGAGNRTNGTTWSKRA